VKTILSDPSALCSPELIAGFRDGHCKLQCQTIVKIVDELFGKGKVSSNSFLHLHPDFKYTRREQNQWSVSGTITPIWITAFQGAKTFVNKGVEKPLIQGWFSESFNQKVANEVLTLSVTDHVPIRFGYAISKNEPANIEIRTVTESSLALFVKGLENEYRVGINDLGVSINK